VQAERTKHVSFEPRALDLIALAVCFAAWWAAWQKTHDLQWPCENDLFRDMGAAQSIIDGQGGADPAYRMERWWYNPLVPGVVGSLGRLGGMPVHEAYATLGTHLNLIAPLGFYAMMTVLFGKRAALAGLIGFIFLGPHQHISWLHATYSPWLWTCNFSQGLFYLSILLVVWTLRKRKPALGIAAGVLVGLTLLAHTAPGFLLGFAVLAVAVGELRFFRREPKAAKRALAIAVIVGGVAALVAWPFWSDVLDHVGRGVKNPTPMRWLAGELEVQYLPRLLGWHASVRGGIAFFGLLHLFFRARRYCRHTRRALIGWGLATTFGLAYGYGSQLVTLPTFLPSWHFYFYLQALESVLFGAGVAAFGTVLVRLACRVRLSRFSGRRLELGIHVACIAPLLVYAGLKYGEYRGRMDLVDNRRAALDSAKARTVELYRWISSNTDPMDVFLAEPEASFYAVATAGRKVVAIQDLFSNPYLDVAQRARDAAAMLEQVNVARWAEFLGTARRYQLGYVALPAGDRERVDEQDVTPLRRVFSATDMRGWDVYRVEEPTSRRTE